MADDRKTEPDHTAMRHPSGLAILSLVGDDLLHRWVVGKACETYEEAVAVLDQHDAVARLAVLTDATTPEQQRGGEPVNDESYADGYREAERYCRERIGKLRERQHHAAPDDRMDVLAALQEAMRLCDFDEPDEPGESSCGGEPAEAWDAVADVAFPAGPSRRATARMDGAPTVARYPSDEEIAAWDTGPLRVVIERAVDWANAQHEAKWGRLESVATQVDEAIRSQGDEPAPTLTPEEDRTDFPPGMTYDTVDDEVWATLCDDTHGTSIPSAVRAAWAFVDRIRAEGAAQERERIVTMLGGELGEFEVGPTETLDDVVRHVQDLGGVMVKLIMSNADLRDKVRAEEPTDAD